MSFKDKILNNQSPWGTPPGGGGPSGNGSGTRKEPPSLEDLIKNFQKNIIVMHTQQLLIIKKYLIKQLHRFLLKKVL